MRKCEAERESIAAINNGDELFVDSSGSDGQVCGDMDVVNASFFAGDVLFVW